jgi:hypothetical protein
MATPTLPGFAEASHDGYTIESNTATSDELRETLGAPSVSEEKSAAARTLGKDGGKAAAEARRAKAKAEKKAAEAEEPAVEGPAKVEEPAEVEAAEAAAGEENSDRQPEKGPAKTPRKPGTPRHDPEARKAEIAAEIREELRLLREARQEREATQKPKPAEAEPAVAEDEAPSWEKYEAEGKSFPEFLKDHTAHAVSQALKKADSERQAREVRETAVKETREFIGSYEKRMNAYAEKNEGFLEALDSSLTEIPPASVLPPSQRRPENFIAQEVISSELAPQLWEYFTENPKEFQRLATLKPLDIVRGIARLEVSLTEDSDAATAGNQRPRGSVVSKAPPPLRPVRSTPSTVDAEPDPDTTDNYDAHVEFRNARDLRKLARR